MQSTALSSSQNPASSSAQNPASSSAHHRPRRNSRTARLRCKIRLPLHGNLCSLDRICSSSMRWNDSNSSSSKLRGGLHCEIRLRLRGAVCAVPRHRTRALGEHLRQQQRNWQHADPFVAAVQDAVDVSSGRWDAWRGSAGEAWLGVWTCLGGRVRGLRGGRLRGRE
ncbi:hypothetical protein C8J57DRAFT_1310675 [Mycena rebaudengoi]|nr:hypothetical protein C8J57DRAFT_1310675 [Mycena rebaudengoi]